jgi:hypothetical protein
MLHFHPLRAGFGLSALVLVACTTRAPAPLADDHPASARAPSAPVGTEPSPLASYRDFGAVEPDRTGTDKPAADHSGHHRDERHQSGPTPEAPEAGHANHQ